MSLFILDTDILSLYESGHLPVRDRVNAQLPGEVAITVMTVEEQLSGWYAKVRKAKTPKDMSLAYRHLAATVVALARWPILDFTELAIGRFRQLKSLKLNMGGMDQSIAAIVLENRGILVTRNARDFKRVPGLTIEDWSV